MTIPDTPPLTVMVASSVYHFQDQLNQIVAALRTYGYRVLNSHAGTIPTHPARSNLENCLEAVRSCDAFLGIIRPLYGSGRIGERSIAHEEMRLAVESKKPRWFLVHSHVTIARQLLKPFLNRKDGKRRTNLPSLRGNPILDDLRVLEMYDDVIQSETPAADRKGHWAQEFIEISQALTYLEAQFADPARVRGIVEEMRGT